MQFLISKEYRKASGIYKITNTIDSRFYIGSAKKFHRRFETHLYALIDDNHANRYLQNFVNKHGIDKLEFNLLELAPLEELEEREQYYLDTLKPWDRAIGFNISPSAESNRGIKKTPEQVEKLRKRLMGNKFCLGREMSEETRDKIRQKKLGVPLTKLKGRIFSPETRAKISATLTGRKSSLSPEKRKENAERQKKKIDQYDITGEILIKEWPSITEAAEALDIAGPNITNVCRCKERHAGGFVWKYHGDDDESVYFRLNTKKKDKRLRIKVAQYDIDMNLIKVWGCAREIRESLGFHSGNIRDACSSHKKYKGFYWFDVFDIDKEYLPTSLNLPILL